MYIHYLCTGAHGATDVTGFGLLGHAQNLAATQKAEVSFKIHTLPGTYIVHITRSFPLALLLMGGSITCNVYSTVLDHMERVATAMVGRGLDFKLKEGLSAETSG